MGSQVGLFSFKEPNDINSFTTTELPEIKKHQIPVAKYVSDLVTFGLRLRLLKAVISLIWLDM